jgi:putative intracellular protease/amidase
MTTAGRTQSTAYARSKVVAGHRMTGFNDRVSYPELVVQPDAEAAGATWMQDAPVVVDRNLVTSRRIRVIPRLSRRRS